MPELFPHDTPEHNFDRLNQLLSTMFGGRLPRFRVGTTKATWPGGANGSSLASQAHGLGVVPVAVFLCPDGPGPWVDWVVPKANFTTQAFQFFARDATGANPAVNTSKSFFFLAVG